MTCFFSLARDRDVGRVCPDPTDARRARVRYTTSAFDRGNVLEGVLRTAEIAYVMGALEVLPCLPGVEAFVRRKVQNKGDGKDERDDDDDDARFQTWLSSLRQRGITSSDPCTLGSAHQMGTCRMSSTAQTGVVDPRGKVWGVQNLYVADASVFPSASGVNPMVTTMGIADWISRGIARDLGPV